MAFKKGGMPREHTSGMAAPSFALTPPAAPGKTALEPAPVNLAPPTPPTAKPATMAAMRARGH